MVFLSSLALLGSVALASAQTTYTASVDLSKKTGTPTHVASGILYGIPDTPDVIPDKWYTTIGFNHNRGGGAQIPGNDTKGWRLGYEQYVPRFESFASNYRTTRKYGGTYILLIHDLWGADGTQGSGGIWPCDNGDCGEWDKFLRQLISDIAANGIGEGLQIDLWNEPNGSGFWPKSLEQWLETYSWAYYRFRELMPGTPLVGPSTSTQPDTTSPWWTEWAAFVKQNQSIPDIYNWHLLGGNRGFTGGPEEDAGYSITQLKTILDTYGLPDRPYQVNEYGPWALQNPNNAAWFITNFEKYNVTGLRANWGSNLGSGQDLHDGMALLVNRNSTADEYYPLADYWVYEYYAMYQTGKKVAVTPSELLWLNLYATVDRKAQRAGILAATGGVGGSYTIEVEGIGAEPWLVKNGKVRVIVEEYRKIAQLAVATGPVLISDTLVKVVNGKLSLPYTLADGTATWSVSLERPR